MAILATTLGLAEKGRRLRGMVESMVSAADARSSGYVESLKAARRTVSLGSIEFDIDLLGLSSPWVAPLYVESWHYGGPFGYNLRTSNFGPETLSEYIGMWMEGIYVVPADVFLREMEGLKRYIAEGKLDDQTHLYTRTLMHNRLKRYAEEEMRKGLR